MSTRDVPAAAPASEGLGALRERYAECAGSAFRVVGDGVDLELVMVSELHASSSQESFSLEFIGPREAMLQQGTHGVHHARFGQVDLFLVPIGLDGDRVRYEAVFNRLLVPPAGMSSEA